jgi:hypothetical protein
MMKNMDLYFLRVAVIGGYITNLLFNVRSHSSLPTFELQMRQIQRFQERLKEGGI